MTDDCLCVGNESVFADYSAGEEDSGAEPEDPPVTVRYPRRICTLSLGLPASECEICHGSCPDAERYREQARELDAALIQESALNHPRCETCSEHHSDGWCTRWAEYYGEQEMRYCSSHSAVRR